MDTQPKNQNCQSDEAPPKYGFDCLPQEIVLDIASRLPITSLLQFTFVRKSFYNLSHDPELVNLHLSRAVKNDPCIIINADYQCYFLKLSDHGIMEEEVVREINTLFVDSTPEFDMVGSCNGLLCVRDTMFSNSLYVYNPFTRAYKELPISLKGHGLGSVSGFDFHPVIKKYKLIKIREPYPNPNRISDVEVYTLGSNRWKSFGEVVYRFDPISRGIMLNEKMHWFTECERYNGYCYGLIVSFDFADEAFGEVPTVDFGVNLNISEFQLVVLGDCLAVALSLPDYKGRGSKIWVMTNYSVKESWMKEFIIGAYTPTPNFITQHMQPLVKVLCLLKNGEILLEYKDENLVSYDPENGVFRKLRFEGMPYFFQTIDIPPADLLQN
ncbi:F-box protein At3g07870-like [Lycium ferocissimum]|uniref:F-box protein At3g07870-like n=1 Tax=Lycium ferocissimum TaxID=112874 RepID=UPI0028150E3D|nr:F-box protein At3g07870-like [Lycium ferocissimum]